MCVYIYMYTYGYVYIYIHGYVYTYIYILCKCNGHVLGIWRDIQPIITVNGMIELIQPTIHR